MVIHDKSNRFPILRFTQEAYDQLKLFAKEHPDRWRAEDVDFHHLLTAEISIENYAEETGVTTMKRPALVPAERGKPHNQADAQAIKYHNSFSGLTPAGATDERMWAWITHFCLHGYSLKRWRRVKNTVPANYVRDHWFVKDGSVEALWLYNSAARPWWLGHTVIKAAAASGGAFTQTEALADFVKYAVHYHILGTKYTFTRSPIVLAEIVRALLREAKGMKAEAGLYDLARRLNLISGTILLDALPRTTLRKLIVGSVEQIMSNVELVSDRRRLRDRRPFRCLNLGAGVQSTALALMAERGEYGLAKPDVAIFADTGWEPPDVYDHLEWLKKELSFEVITVSAGNIRDNILSGIQPDGKAYLGIPAHIVNPDGSEAVSKRQCTDDYKIRPIQGWLREHLDLTPGRRAPKDVQVEMWLGISVDEVERQKDSRDEWITKVYPLIDRGFGRAQLQSWFHAHYPGRYLPRSSCIGCPYKSDGEWKRLQAQNPNSFQDAVFVDQALRDVPTVRDAITAKGGVAYLHRSRVPLRDADFSDATDYDQHMQEECEGVCGI